MFVQGSHAFAMFSTHALREGRGYARINVTSFTRFVQYCSMGTLLALYGSTMQCSCTLWVFWTIFFLLSVPAHLKKKQKTITLDSAITTVEFPETNSIPMMATDNVNTGNNEGMWLTIKMGHNNWKSYNVWMPLGVNLILGLGPHAASLYSIRRTT